MVDSEKTLDGWYGKLQKRVSAKIGSFIAFEFMLIALGALIGLMVAQHSPQNAYIAVIVPAAAGAFAYYNRTIATFLFILLILSFIIFI